MLGDLLREDIYRRLKAGFDLSEITEVRFRLSKPVMVSLRGRIFPLKAADGGAYIAEKADLEFALGVASGFSVYAVNDTLIKGYLHYGGGIRIGVTGDGVSDGNRLITLKEISGMLIRVPHEIKGAADRFIGEILTDGGIKNTLVLSPPGGGKTTMLRELARRASLAGYNVLVIDERYELAASEGGIPSMDLGDNTDVIGGVSKLAAYENTIRAMSPDLIVTDELFRSDECDAVCDIARSGVGVFASVHAEGLADIERSRVFRPLLSVFDRFVTLSKVPFPGTVKEIYKRR
ncbi:MAG: hypothetical protein LBT55_03580 [Clostridiaceae bacterium]|jgi:stage III sporulation protein AA|nr:hypothetical protein [Clostridiaceae bacterium]